MYNNISLLGCCDSAFYCLFPIWAAQILTQFLSQPFLNVFMDVAFTTLSSKLFHEFITLCEKNVCLALLLHLGFFNLKACPRLLGFSWKNMLLSTLLYPFRILKVFIKLPLNRPSLILIFSIFSIWLHMLHS